MISRSFALADRAIAGISAAHERWIGESWVHRALKRARVQAAEEVLGRYRPRVDALREGLEGREPAARTNFVALAERALIEMQAQVAEGPFGRRLLAQADVMYFAPDAPEYLDDERIEEELRQNCSPASTVSTP